MPRERETKNHLGKEDLLFHFKVIGIDIRYRSIITSFYTRGNTISVPVRWLRGPRFLVAWNIHILCNLSFATCGIVTHGIIMHGIVMRGTITRRTGHARNNHE